MHVVQAVHVAEAYPTDMVILACARHSPKQERFHSFPLFTLRSLEAVRQAPGQAAQPLSIRRQNGAQSQQPLLYVCRQHQAGYQACEAAGELARGRHRRGEADACGHQAAMQHPAVHAGRQLGLGCR